MDVCLPIRICRGEGWHDLPPRGKGPLGPSRLDGLDVGVREAHVMADFVDEDMGDKLTQGYIAQLRPLLEDRAAIEKDPRLVRRGIEHRAAGAIDALIEAAEFEDVLDARSSS